MSTRLDVALKLLETLLLVDKATPQEMLIVRAVGMADDLLAELVRTDKARAGKTPTVGELMRELSSGAAAR